MRQFNLELNLEIAKAILITGQFICQDQAGLSWKRELPEEQTAVIANLTGGEFALSIQPGVSTFAGHANKRLAAGVYFEISAKFAERVQGTITQYSNVGECKGPNGETEHVLAIYPDLPLRFERCCLGFQAVFLGESHV